MAGAAPSGSSAPLQPTRVFTSGSRAPHEKNIPPNWVEVCSPMDFRRYPGSTGVAVVNSLIARGYTMYCVKHGGGLNRTVENWIIRDNFDRLISYGPGVLQMMIPFIHRELRAFLMDFRMIHAFLPKLDDLLHGGGIQFRKEDFCHLKCMNEAFRFAGNYTRNVAGVSDYLVTLLATGPLGPKQMTQFVHFLYVYEFPNATFDAIAAPTGFKMNRIRLVYRVDTGIPKFDGGIQRRWSTLSDYVTAFAATLLVNQECERAVKLLIKDGVPGVSEIIHKQTKDDSPWPLTLKETQRFLQKKIDHGIRIGKNRLFYKHLAGMPHPRKDQIVEPYTIPCPFGCVTKHKVEERLMEIRLRIAPGKFIESHVKVTHGNKEVIKCPECGLTLLI